MLATVVQNKQLTLNNVANELLTRFLFSLRLSHLYLELLFLNGQSWPSLFDFPSRNRAHEMLKVTWKLPRTTDAQFFCPTYPKCFDWLSKSAKWIVGFLGYIRFHFQHILFYHCASLVFDFALIRLFSNKKCIFMLFLSLCRTVSQPYRLSHINALRIN